MRHLRSTFLAAVIVVEGTSIYRRAWAEDAGRGPPPPTTPVLRSTGSDRPKLLGVGYKAGNALGGIGGDLIVSPLPHLDIDLQMGWFPRKYGGPAFGITPTIRATLNGSGRSTPYLSAGFTYRWLRFANGTPGSSDGVLANVGYLWKWTTGFEILAGGGLLYMRRVEASDPGIFIYGAEGLRFNLEFGLRYRFL